MQQLVDPPNTEMERPTHLYERRAAAAKGSGNSTDNDTNFVDQLEAQLEEQVAEEKKWTKLTKKLDAHTKHVAATVIRLTTSTKVFQGELTKRSDVIDRMQAQLEEKQDRADAQLEDLAKDHIQQQEQAVKARETIERTQEELDVTEYKHNRVTKRFAEARRKCQELEDRVEALEINLRNNQSSLASHQRDYMQAEWQVERDHLDNYQQLVLKLKDENAQLEKECGNLKGKVGLFQDEQKRRTLRAESVHQKLESQKAFFKDQLAKSYQEVKTAQKDRDEWEEKTKKLVTQTESTTIELAKLEVKVGLFRRQLETVATNVQRLQARILLHQDEQHESKEQLRQGGGGGEGLYAGSNSNTVTDDDGDVTDVTVDDDGDDDSGDESSRSSNSGRASPTSVAKLSARSAPVWKPPVVPSKVAIVTPKAVLAVAAAAAAQSYKAPPVMAPQQPVRVDRVHFNVKVQPSTPNSAKHENAAKSQFQSQSSWLSVPPMKQEQQLGELQQDFQNQKRLEEEQTAKIERQLARLASKVEVLVAGGGSGSGYSSGRSDASTSGTKMKADQFSSLKSQIQQDLMKDSGVAKLMQQTNQKCIMVSTKVEGLVMDIKQRDQRYYDLEKRLQDNEVRHTQQLDQLKAEMERYFKTQKEVFEEKLNDAVYQMQTAARRTSIGGNSSMVSLDSLYPMEGSKRDVQVTFNEPQAEAGPNLYAPTVNGKTGLSMASGIMMNKPLFQGLSATVGKSKQ